MNPGADTAYSRERRSGATPEQWIEALTQQDNKCAICRRADVKLVADHDHVSGKFRGAICRMCNSWIGVIRESLETLDRAREYLSRASQPPAVL